jgi:hypothetical protein
LKGWFSRSRVVGLKGWFSRSRVVGLKGLAATAAVAAPGAAAVFAAAVVACGALLLSGLVVVVALAASWGLFLFWLSSKLLRRFTRVNLLPIKLRFRLEHSFFNSCMDNAHQSFAFGWLPNI